MATPNTLTGYGPGKGLNFDENKDQYESWEGKFLLFMRIQKLYDIFVPSSDERELQSFSKVVGIPWF